VINDSVAGMMNAAPTPATMREAISTAGPLTSSGAAEAAVNSASPNSIAPRRP